MSEINNSGFVSGTVKGILVSVAFVLLGILLFALLIGIFGFSSSVIKPVNQVIKVLSIFCGVMLCVRGGKGLIKGALVGFFSIILTYAVFAFMGGEGLFNVMFVLDLIFGAVIGAISGIISVNVKKGG